MANLRDLVNKIKSNLSDDQGWFRQNNFTPVKQIQSIAPVAKSNFSQNIRQLPTIANNFLIDQTRRVEQMPVMSPNPINTAGNLATKAVTSILKNNLYNPESKTVLPVKGITMFPTSHGYEKTGNLKKDLEASAAYTQTPVGKEEQTRNMMTYASVIGNINWAKTPGQFLKVAELELDSARQTLGLKKGASLAEIKSAYNNWVRSNHPDVITGKGGSAQDVAMANAKLQQINDSISKLENKIPNVADKQSFREWFGGIFNKKPPVNPNLPAIQPKTAVNPISNPSNFNLIGEIEQALKSDFMVKPANPENKASTMIDPNIVSKIDDAYQKIIGPAPKRMSIRDKAQALVDKAQFENIPNLLKEKQYDVIKPQPLKIPNLLSKMFDGSLESQSGAINFGANIGKEPSVQPPTTKPLSESSDSLAPKGVETKGIKIKTTSGNQPTSPKLTVPPQTPQPNKTTLSKPENIKIVGTSQYPSPDINTERLNIPTKSKEFIDKTVEEVKPQIEKVVGKKLSNQEALNLADNSAKVLNKAVTRAETLAWEAKMLKARQLLAKQATEGTVTQEYIDNLLAVKSQGSDIARKLQSMSQNVDGKEVTAKQAILEAVMKVTEDTEAILNKAKGVDFNDYEQAASFYREFVKPTAGDWLDKLRYSSMLSSPNTHINNFSSNWQGTGFIAPLEKTIAGGVDKLASVLRPGRQRKQFTGEGVAYAKGYLSNVGKAWNNFTDTLSGKKLSSAQEMYSLPLSSKGTFKRGVESVLEVPGKLLQAGDEFFQALTSGGVESSLKYRESKGIKISGIEDKAYLEARKRLFNAEFGLKEEGYLLKALEFIPQKVAEARASSNPIVSTIAKYTFPFVRVPANVFKASIEYGPLGVGTIPGASNKTEQLAKSILGSVVGMITATLVAGDNMTWAEPTDQTKRNAFRAAGMQPYSIRVGDKWYSYSKMHPAISFNLALVAAIRDSEKNKLLDDKQIEVLLDGASKWVNFYADMSYVKNIGDAVSGVKGDISAGTRQISNYVQQLVPFRALMGWVARLIDPQQRQVDPDGTLLNKQLQQLMTQIPGLSDNVPARVDSKGDPVENQNRVINAFSPIRVTNAVPEKERFYKSAVTKTNNTRQENIIKDRVLKTGEEEVFNGKKYYPSFETDSKTGEKKPIVKSIKVSQSTSEIYEGLGKEYQVSEDAPTNFIGKVITYGTGIFKDPKGTINAVKTGQPIRKVRGDAVVVERLKGLDTLDQGDQATQVDHIIALALGGTNDESNLQIISTQDNQAKGVVDTYLANLLENGDITKKEAQERDLNWRAEIANLSDKDKNMVANIMAKEPPAPTEKVDTGILSKLSGKEYQLYDEEKQTYSNIQVKIPEVPKLTGQKELDKGLKSSYSSKLTTASTNIKKLYLAGKITAKEAEDALLAIKALRSKSSGSGKKAKKVPGIKISNITIPKLNFKMAGISGSPKGVRISQRPNLTLSKPSTTIAKLPAYKVPQFRIAPIRGLTVGTKLA